MISSSQLPALLIIVDLLTKATLLLCLISLAERLLVRQSAALRHCLWLACFAGLATLPCVTLILPTFPMPVLSQTWLPEVEKADGNAILNRVENSLRGERDPIRTMESNNQLNVEHTADRFIPTTGLGSGAEGTTNVLPAINADELMAQTASDPTQRTLRGEGTWLSTAGNLGTAVIIVIWLIGIPLTLLPLIGALWRNRRIRRQSRLILVESLGDEAGELIRRRLNRHVVLRESNHGYIPMTWGIRYPTILLPSPDWTDWTQERLGIVLLHELAHIKRMDVLWQLFSRIVCSLYWFHPLVWRAHRRMRSACELACDDSVLSNGVIPSNYAQHLVNVAREFQTSTSSLAMQMAKPIGLERRVRAILNHQGSRRPLSRFTLSTTVLCSVFLSVLFTIPKLAAEPVLQEVSKTTDDDQAEVTATNPADAIVTVSGSVMDDRGEPVSGAVVRVFRAGGSTNDTPAVSDSNGNFSLTFDVKPGEAGLRKVGLVASDAAGVRLGYYRFDRHDESDVIDSVAIQLAPTKTIRAQVVDGEGKIVVDANLAFHLGSPFVHAVPIDPNTGIGSLSVPSSERVESVIAWKEDVGFDFRSYVLSKEEQADMLSSAPEFPLDQPERLELTGATPARFKAVDAFGQPVENVRLSPVFFRKGPYSSLFSASAYSALLAKQSSAEGEVTFSWFPNWQQEMVVFRTGTPEFQTVQVRYDPLGQDSADVAIKLERLVPIRGTIRDSAGNPAPGILIVANGAGYSGPTFRGEARTDANGNYELFVAPEQIYMLVIRDRRRGAAFIDGLAVRKDTPVEGIDLTLKPITRIFGTVRDVESSEPVRDGRLFVERYGRALNSLEGIQLDNPRNLRKTVQPMFELQVSTNSLGEFEFFLGEGTYRIAELGLQNQRRGDRMEFNVSGTPELQLDFQSHAQAEDALPQLVGVAVDQASGIAEADCTISGAGRESLKINWRATSGVDGKFRVRRTKETAVVYAISADRKKAAVAEVAPESKAVVISLQEVGSVRGRLLNPDGNDVLPMQKITFGMAVWNERKSSMVLHFGGQTVTDANGNFQLDGIVAGVEYMFTVYGSDFQSVSLTAPGEQLELGDVKVSPPENF